MDDDVLLIRKSEVERIIREELGLLAERLEELHSDIGNCGHDHVDTFASGAGRRVDICMGCRQVLRFWHEPRDHVGGAA